jgi:pyrroline-5-carboxylate reductase
MKVEIIGVGSLGSAMAEALLTKGVVAPNEMVLRNKSVTPYLALQKGNGVDVRGPREANEASHDPAPRVLVFAVKPQDAHDALLAWRHSVRPPTIVLSVMAGIRVSQISEVVDTPAVVVRAMPNLGAQISKSATAFYAPPDASNDVVPTVKRVLEAFGSSWQLLSEDLLDAATAIAGSGPAYFCWLAERMIEAAVEFGFEREQALEMVRQTLKGTSELLTARNIDPSSLRQQVTSAGGTTAAALSVLQRHGCEQAFEEAFAAARERAAELSTRK